MLQSAIECAKPGGVIVYSTCTLSCDENEGVISQILAQNKNIVAEAIQIPKFSFDPPLSFDPHLRHCVRIDPTPDLEGFFITKLRKL